MGNGSVLNRETIVRSDGLSINSYMRSEGAFRTIFADLRKEGSWFAAKRKVGKINRGERKVVGSG